MNYSTPDLTQHPPRSPRARLGGYVLLPRCLDKCRASLAGKNGDYHYACPLDQRFLQFTGINPDKLKAEVAKGLSDGEVLAWVKANAPQQRSDAEIAQWSAYAEQSTPMDNESREYFNELWLPRRPDSVKTSEAGSTCSTWMTTSALAASRKGRMPYANIKITREGATPKQKAALIRGVTQLLVDLLHKNPETTVVTIEEVDTDNWGIGGVSITERRRRERESRRKKGKA